MACMPCAGLSSLRSSTYAGKGRVRRAGPCHASRRLRRLSLRREQDGNGSAVGCGANVSHGAGSAGRDGGQSTSGRPDDRTDHGQDRAAGEHGFCSHDLHYEPAASGSECRLGGPQTDHHGGVEAKFAPTNAISGGLGAHGRVGSQRARFGAEGR